MGRYLAQCVKIAGQEICGPVEIDGGEVTLATIINQLLYKLIFPIAGVLLFLYLVWGGYEFLLSGGNPERVKSGKAKITSAIVGFILLVFSYLIARLIALIFGLEGI